MRANLAATRHELEELKQAVVGSEDEAQRKGGSLLRALRDFFTDLLKGDYSKLEVSVYALSPPSFSVSHLNKRPCKAGGTWIGGRQLAVPAGGMPLLPPRSLQPRPPDSASHSTLLPVPSTSWHALDVTNLLAWQAGAPWFYNRPPTSRLPPLLACLPAALPRPRRRTALTSTRSRCRTRCTRLLCGIEMR